MWPVMGVEWKCWVQSDVASYGVEWKCWVQSDVASYGGGMEMLGSK